MRRRRRHLARQAEGPPLCLGRGSVEAPFEGLFLGEQLGAGDDLREGVWLDFFFSPRRCMLCAPRIRAAGRGVRGEEKDAACLTLTVQRPHWPCDLQPKIPSKKSAAALAFIARSRKSPRWASTTFWRDVTEVERWFNKKCGDVATRISASPCRARRPYHRTRH